MKERFILCPVCKQKTRATIRPDTEAVHLPLYCPKCKNVTVINIKHGVVELSQ